MEEDEELLASPERTELASLALEAVRSVTVAELHGAAVGLALHGAEHLSVQQLVALLGSDALHDAGSIDAFIQAALQGLYADDLSFAPLLLPSEPSEFDAAACELRGSAIADWSSAFLSGFACGLASGDGDFAHSAELAGAMAAEDAVAAALGGLPPEGAEIVQDLLAIAQLDTQIALSEDAESALVELEEYLKVGTLLLQSMLDAGEAVALDG